MLARHQFESDEEYNAYLKLYYAGLAMQSLIVSDEWFTERTAATPALVADYAFVFADKMVNRK